jgi:hypothetical protein
MKNSIDLSSQTPKFLKKQRNRQISVVLTVFLLISSNLANIYNFPLISTFILFIIPFVSIALNVSTNNLVHLKNSQIDEREDNSRNQSYKFSYRILSIVLTLFCTISWLYSINVEIFNINFPKISGLQAMNLVLSVFLLSSSLPTWVTAWFQMDSIED